MIHIKTRLGSLAVPAAVIGVVAFGTAQAFASSAPTVITYEKTCVAATGHCHGDTGDGGTIDMQVTGFAATGEAAQLTLTERITFPGGAWFEAAMSGVVSRLGSSCSTAPSRPVRRLVLGRAGPPAKQPRRRRRDHDDVDRRAPAHAGGCVSPITEAGRGWAESQPYPRGAGGDGTGGRGWPICSVITLIGPMIRPKGWYVAG
jgi:hypothetical protein